jgi:hypothetical protein
LELVELVDSTPPVAQTNGSNSVFSTITSTGGGYGARNDRHKFKCYFRWFWWIRWRRWWSKCPGSTNSGGAGNTPPISPPQGNNGGNGNNGSTLDLDMVLVVEVELLQLEMLLVRRW